MKRKTVRGLLPKDDDLPLARDIQRFVTFYMSSFDLKEAACKIGLPPEAGEKLFRVARIKAVIQKRVNLVEMERAKLNAKAATLTADRLDSALVQEVDNRKSPHVRIRAIELGYRRVGLIKDNEFYIAPDPNQPKNQPGIYQRQTTAKRTVTEEVTRTETVLDPIFAVKEY